jgi:chemosensory pili system protein ChpA (sensor histidine kinase/response regulator)
MDVVATEVKKLGGALHMDSKAGEGTRFTIRLPFTLAISHALVVRVEDELYALPLPTVEGVVRLSRDEVASAPGARWCQLRVRRPELPAAAARRCSSG